MVLLGTFACRPPEPAEPELVPGADTTWLAEGSAAELRQRADVLEATFARIASLDQRGPELRSLIAVDRAARGGAGLLAGLPIAVKDNVDVAGFATTAGSLALAGHRPADDAFAVARLREEGAVLVAKANLSEWANFRSERSSSGWSALGGQTRNPHALDRNPCGSSSGSAVAVAAGLAVMAVGTETDGSILCRRRSSAWWGSSPPWGWSAGTGSCPSPTPRTRRARSPAPSRTRP